MEAVRQSVGVDAVKAGFLKRRLGEPLFHLLRTGATPERLAWSLAIGVAIGINPLLGSTTLLALAAAPLLRLNLVASQIANQVAYPLELLLFPVFIRLGVLLFRTEGLPLDREMLFHMARLHPWLTTRLLWRWEWHALVVWAAFAVVATPLMALAFRPLLAKMVERLEISLAEAEAIEK